MKIVLKILKWFTNKLGDIHRGQFITDEISHFLKYDYSYQMLLDKDLQDTPIVTKRKIKFKDNLELGCNKKDIIFTLGQPQHIHHNRNIKGHQILFYKSMIDGNRTNTVMHLYHNQFCLGMYLIKVKQEEKKGVIERLKQNYGIEGELSYNSKIKDKAGNVIKIEDFNYITIGYFHFQNPDFQTIAEQILSRDIKNVPE